LQFPRLSYDFDFASLTVTAPHLENHLEYRDFKLMLQGIDDGGADAWKKLLTAHFEGCES